MQSLSTFHRVVKKLARFYGQFFFDMICLFLPIFTYKSKNGNREKKNMAYRDISDFLFQKFQFFGILEGFMARKLESENFV